MVTSGQVVRLADSGKERIKDRKPVEMRLLVPKYRPIIPALLSSHSDWLSPSLMLQGSCLIGLVRAFSFFMEPQKGPTPCYSTPVLAPFLSRSLGRLPTLCRAFGTLSGSARKGRKTLADIGTCKMEGNTRRKLRAPHAYDCLFSISTEPCRASPSPTPPATSLSRANPPD